MPRRKDAVYSWKRNTSKTERDPEIHPTNRKFQKNKKINKNFKVSRKARIRVII